MDAVLFKPLNKEMWNAIDTEVAACHKNKRERPTVAAVMYHVRSKKYLLITSTTGGLLNPGLVKGGVERGEGAHKALVREISQELCISKRAIKIKGYGGSYDVPSQHEKDGCRIKRYFVFLVGYKGPHKLHINGELSGSFWYLINEIPGVLDVALKNHPHKLVVLKHIFASPQLHTQKAPRVQQATGR